MKSAVVHNRQHGCLSNPNSEHIRSNAFHAMRCHPPGDVSAGSNVHKMLENSWTIKVPGWPQKGLHKLREPGRTSINQNMPRDNLASPSSLAALNNDNNTIKLLIKETIAATTSNDT